MTPCDNSKTKKEGASRTYKGCDGYAPIMAYIGREGCLINCGLREGCQHCQKHTPVLFRLDSGNDSTDNIGIFLEGGCPFITKRNLRRESKRDGCRE